MEDSILKSIKKLLHISEGDAAFDDDVLMHINSVFGTLHQLGIGPAGGFAIEDEEPTWSAFLDGDPRFNAVKTYVYLKVRLAFDPPTTAHLVDAITEQIRENEWRLNVVHENDPPPPPILIP